MRELTKSTISYTWAMSIFGVNQMLKMLNPSQWNGHRNGPTDDFNQVTQATFNTLGGVSRSMFCAGDNLQRGVVDLVFGAVMGAGGDADRWARMSGDAMRGMDDSGRQTAQSAADFASGMAGAAAGSAGASGNAAGGNGSPGTPRNSGAQHSYQGWGPIPR